MTALLWLATTVAAGVAVAAVWVQRNIVDIIRGRATGRLLAAVGERVLGRPYGGSRGPERP